MRDHRDYLGSRFELWKSQRAWFWRLNHPDHDGAMIGIAGSEAEAIRDARLSIEEISSRQQAEAASARATVTNVATPMFRRCVPIPLGKVRWSGSLTDPDCCRCANA